MLAALASLPIGIVVIAMAGLHWRAANAGLLGLAVALLLGLTVFGLGQEGLAGIGPVRATGGAMLEALFTTATILWIIFPALCIYEVQQRSGAFDVIRGALARLSDDPRILVLLVAWFFGLFMEGVAGFGTPVALAAPILVGLGFSPIKALTLALVGHAAGVSFGAIGTPVLPQMTATDLSGTALAQPAALLHGLLGWSLVTVLFIMAKPGRPALREWRWPALATAAFFVPSVALAVFVGPELPTVGGAIIGGGIFALLVRRSGGGANAETESRTQGAGASSGIGAGAMVRAALPYLVILGLILITRLIAPLRERLRDIALDWAIADTFSGRFEPLYHPGTLLFAGFIIGAALQGRSASELGTAIGGAARRLVPVTAALLAMLGLSRVMVHAQMIDALAEAAAASGAIWPLIAPFIGVLGTFITGSATSSNILFTDFQQVTAQSLSMPVALLQGVQNFGAAIGNIISPHNIVAGAATVGLAQGREGAVMRTTLLVCLVYAAAGGALTFGFIVLR